MSGHAIGKSLYSPLWLTHTNKWTPGSTERPTISSIWLMEGVKWLTSARVPLAFVVGADFSRQRQLHREWESFCLFTRQPACDTTLNSTPFYAQHSHTLTSSTLSLPSPHTEQVWLLQGAQGSLWTPLLHHRRDGTIYLNFFLPSEQH